jgi:hypothetical protein
MIAVIQLRLSLVSAAARIAVHVQALAGFQPKAPAPEADGATPKDGWRCSGRKSQECPNSARVVGEQALSQNTGGRLSDVSVFSS